MKTLPFKSSADLSMGLEVELQLVNPRTFNLVSKAKALLHSTDGSQYAARITPEITQSMLEINSSVHKTASSLSKELNEICAFLVREGQKHTVYFAGGGTHPFQRWVSRKIFPLDRYRKLAKRYKYMAKRSTVFGLHLHVGCSTPEKAIYLSHILGRYVPQLLALSASSPFYQSIDTGYCSARPTIFNTYPLCGVLPYVTDWQAFSDYYYEMQALGIVESMKDFYWDIRPKPEFGTVEVRVCDAPLTIQKSLMVAAYIQSLASYILCEEPFPMAPEAYMVYSHNKFQATRYGLEGFIIDPYSHQRKRIMDDILTTLELIQPHSQRLGNVDFLAQLSVEVVAGRNDTVLLREIYEQTGSLKEVVREQCRLFSLSQAPPLSGQA